MTDIQQHSTAMVPAGINAMDSFGAAMRPRTYQDAVNMANLISKSSICPKSLKGDPMAIMVAVSAGERHGFDILGSIQNFAVINGKPCVYGDALLGICRSSPVFESIEETHQGSVKDKSYSATCTVRRRGDKQPISTTFTWAMAEQAKLINKPGPWVEYKERMFQMRARGWALRDAFPDVLSGLITREEAEDFVTDAQTGNRVERPKGHVIDAADVPQAAQVQQPAAREMTEQAFREIQNVMQLAATLEELDGIRTNVAKQNYAKSEMKAKLQEAYRSAKARISADVALAMTADDMPDASQQGDEEWTGGHDNGGN